MNGLKRRKGLPLSLALDVKVIFGTKMKKKKHKEKSIVCHAVQCAECLKVLGLSIKNFQEENIFCLKCGKNRIMELDFEREEFKR